MTNRTTGFSQHGSAGFSRHRNSWALAHGIPASLLAVLLLCFPTACTKDPPQTPQPPPIRNVIIITIDTLRVDALSIYGNPTPSPSFEKLATQSAVFENAYTTAPITLPAHTSLFTGLYPPSHGVRNNGTFRADENLLLLSEIARERGMTTGAFLGAFPLASKFGLDQGFDVYEDLFQAVPQPGSLLYAENTAEQVRTKTEAWLQSIQNKPFFLWIHFFDPHHPYQNHKQFTGTPYEQEVQYTDQQLGLFLDFLKSKQLDQNTLLIATSDHGEAFGEHGEVSHTIFLYNTTLHIPLLISGPGIQHQRRKEIVRLIDVFPTVLDAMNWTSKSNVDGRSLKPLLDGKPLPEVTSYSETLAPDLDFGWSPLFGIQDQKYKYISAPRPELYDLQKDTREAHNLMPSTESQDYESEITRILQRQAPSVSSPALTSEEREKLASLGYVSTSKGAGPGNKPDPKDRIETARKIAELAMTDLSIEEKVKAYRDLSVQEPSNPVLTLRYAEILLSATKFSEAEKQFLKILALEYSSATVYNGLASTYFRQNKMDQAEKILEVAVNKKIADGETYYNLAEFYFHRGMQPKAFEYYERSMKLEFMPAYHRKARIEQILGKEEEALKILAKAKNVNPLDGETNYHAGMIEFRRKQFNRAVSEFQEALRKKPDATWIHYNLALAYKELGDHENAKHSFRAFLQHGPAQLKSEREAAQEYLRSQSN